MPSFINTLLNIYAVFHNLYQALIWIWNKIQNSHRRTVRESSQWPDNHDGVITHLEPDILECEVKRVLGSITMNKANGGDGAEVFKILNDDAVIVLHLICQQIWKTQQWS